MKLHNSVGQFSQILIITSSELNFNILNLFLRIYKYICITVLCTINTVILLSDYISKKYYNIIILMLALF